MNILKGLQKTALLSTALTVFAFGVHEATAADTVSDVGHVSASVGSLLSIVETTPIKFGNIVVTTTGASAGDGTVVMTNAGIRTAPNAGTDQITLLEGATNTVPGGDDAGAESPGFYAVSGATANANIYITFAKTGSAVALIDANHPTNKVTLHCGGCATPGADFFVDTFTFNKSGTDAVYGDYITVNGSGAATVQVGATLHTDPAETGTAATDYPDGAYTGTFDIMASY